jgi:hypothetical protein
MSDSQKLASLIIGSTFIGSILYIDKVIEESKREHFADISPMSRTGPVPNYPQNPQFYGNKRVSSNQPYSGPNGAIPQGLANINLNASGDQLLAYQLYQQAVNAATPTSQQLASISGESQMQTGLTADQLKGGLSSDYAPYNVLSDNGPQLFSSEYQAVNLGNPRADAISACAQNAPTFIATSLLPKPTVPGQESWNIGAPQGVLASQNFLAATQQLGVDTVLSSLKNPSYDIRGDIPNPISILGPFNNTTITPDLTRRALTDFVDNSGGPYGSVAGFNQNPTYVNM